MNKLKISVRPGFLIVSISAWLKACCGQFPLAAVRLSAHCYYA